MKYVSIENELLYRVCYYSLLPSPHEWIFNSKTLTNIKGRDWKDLQISKYKARNYLHSWEEQGLIRKAYIGGQDDEGHVRCYHGFVITDEMEKTEPYKQADKEVMKYVAEWINS